MNEEEQTIKINFEAEIIERIEDLIANKKRENEKVIGRLNTLEISWNDVNTDLDKEVTGEIDLLGDEEEAIDKAKKRLKRNICVGVDKKTFSVAGRVEDIDSKIGLPGLTVKISIGSTDKEEFIAKEKTDSYGNFCADIPIKQLMSRKGPKKSLVFEVFLKPGTIIHSEEVQVKPKGGGVEHVTLLIKCTEKLSESLDYGRLVNESIESDEELLKSRATNMKEAYKAYGRLTDTTLSQIRSLKDKLTVSAPRVIVSDLATEEPLKG